MNRIAPLLDSSVGRLTLRLNWPLLRERLVLNPFGKEKLPWPARFDFVIWFKAEPSVELRLDSGLELHLNAGALVELAARAQLGRLLAPRAHRAMVFAINSITQVEGEIALDVCLGDDSFFIMENLRIEAKCPLCGNPFPGRLQHPHLCACGEALIPIEA